jgi:hypothetical protein
VLVSLLDFDARPWPCAIPGGELLVPFVAASFGFRVLRAMPPLRSLRAPGDGGCGGWWLASLPAYATLVGPAAAAVISGLPGP